MTLGGGISITVSALRQEANWRKWDKDPEIAWRRKPKDYRRDQKDFRRRLLLGLGLIVLGAASLVYVGVSIFWPEEDPG